MSLENPKLTRIRAVLVHCGSNLAEEIDPTINKVLEMPFAVRRAIADVLMDEFLKAGMTPDHEENEYGLEIEALVDYLQLANRF